jgi:hypothetical protein
MSVPKMLYFCLFLSSYFRSISTDSDRTVWIDVRYRSKSTLIVLRGNFFYTYKQSWAIVVSAEPATSRASSYPVTGQSVSQYTVLLYSCINIAIYLAIVILFCHNFVTFSNSADAAHIYFPHPHPLFPARKLSRYSQSCSPLPPLMPPWRTIFAT